MERLAQRAATSGWKSTLRAGNDAAGAVRTQSAPGILHIATHGYFIDRVFDQSAEDQLSLDTKGEAPARLRTLSIPWIAAACSLQERRTASSNGRSVRRWPRKMTACCRLEAADMDLRGTWLVTLSACDTGAADPAQVRVSSACAAPFLRRGENDVYGL